MLAPVLREVEIDRDKRNITECFRNHLLAAFDRAEGDRTVGPILREALEAGKVELGEAKRDSCRTRLHMRFAAGIGHAGEAGRRIWTRLVLAGDYREKVRPATEKREPDWPSLAG